MALSPQEHIKAAEEKLARGMEYGSSKDQALYFAESFAHSSLATAMLLHEQVHPRHRDPNEFHRGEPPIHGGHS